MPHAVAVHWIHEVGPGVVRATAPASSLAGGIWTGARAGRGIGEGDEAVRVGSGLFIRLG